MCFDYSTAVTEVKEEKVQENEKCLQHLSNKMPKDRGVSVITARKRNKACNLLLRWSIIEI